MTYANTPLTPGTTDHLPAEEGGENSSSGRARGCMMGQLAGDSLGSLVEFMGPQEIRRRYPAGVRHLADGGTWGTLAGQPTDDSEMALELARTLVQHQRYEPDAALAAYRAWMASEPFDMGLTTRAGLVGRHNAESQANGALMRISPLGILGARHGLEDTGRWAQQDAALTHPHPVCLQANALFAMAIAQAIRAGESTSSLHEQVSNWAADMKADASLKNALQLALDAPPANYVDQQGWVVTAFHNAFWQLLHAPSLEDGVVDTVMRGGDTDTNAAICGALLGAVHGLDAVPERWTRTVLACRPSADRADVRRPRPQRYWPMDALELADALLGQP